MARAKIELKKGLTHRGNGRILRLGFPQTITDPAEILYYEGVGTVKVTDLDGKKSKNPKKHTNKNPAGKELKKEKPIVKETPTTEEELSGPALEETAPEESPEEPSEATSEETDEDDDDKEPEGEQEKNPNKTVFTKKSLRPKSKSALIDIAVGMGSWVDDSDKKDVIIDAILDAQEG